MLFLAVCATNANPLLAYRVKKRIDGYPGHGSLFCMIDDWQHRRDIIGNVLEIDLGLKPKDNYQANGPIGDIPSGRSLFLANQFFASPILSCIYLISYRRGR